MSINHPQRGLQEVYVAVEPLDIEYTSTSCSRFSNKRALVLLKCCLCHKHSSIAMRELFTVTGALVPGPRDSQYTYTCASCNPSGIPSLVHLSKTWTQAISTAIYNMAHQIGVDERLYARANEGDGSSGWYPFFDIATEICPFINRFWDQLTPSNTAVYHSWATKVSTTLSTHNDLFMPSKRVYMCDKAPPARKWGVLYTHMGKAKEPKLERLADRRVHNGEVQYLVKWRGFTRFAWEADDCISTKDKLDAHQGFESTSEASLCLCKPSKTSETNEGVSREEAPVKPHNVIESEMPSEGKVESQAISNIVVIMTKIATKATTELTEAHTSGATSPHYEDTGMHEQTPTVPPVKPVQPIRCATEFPHNLQATSTLAERPLVMATHDSGFAPLTPAVAVPSVLVTDSFGDTDSFNESLYTPNPKRPRLSEPVSFSRAIASEIAKCSGSFLSSPSRPNAQNNNTFAPLPQSTPKFIPPIAPAVRPTDQWSSKPTPERLQSDSTTEPNSSEHNPISPEKILMLSTSSRNSRHAPRQCVGASADTSTSNIHPDAVIAKEPPSSLSPSPRATSSSSPAPSAQSVRSSPRLVSRAATSASTPSTLTSVLTSSHLSLTPPSPNKRMKSITPTPPRPTSRSSSNSPESPSIASSSQAAYQNHALADSPILIDNISTTLSISPNKSPKQKSQHKNCSTTPLSPNANQTTFLTENIESMETIIPPHILNSHRRKPKHLHKRYLKKLNQLPLTHNLSTTTTTTTTSTTTRTSPARIPTRLSQKLALLSRNRRASPRVSSTLAPTSTTMATHASSSSDTPRSTRLSQRIAQIQETHSTPAAILAKSPPKKISSPIKPTSAPSTPNGRSVKIASDGTIKRPPPCSCHQCKSQKTQVATCSCLKKFCNACLRIHYDEDWAQARKDPTWVCPFCRTICTCKACRVKKNPHEAPVVRHAPATRIVAKYAQRMHTHAQQRASTLRKPAPPTAPVFVPPAPAISTHAAHPHHAVRKRQKLTVDAYDLDRFVASSPIPLGMGDSKIAERIRRDLHTPGWVILYTDLAQDGYTDLTTDLVSGNWHHDWMEPYEDGSCDEEVAESKDAVERREAIQASEAAKDDDQEMNIPGLQSLMDRKERALRRSLRAKEEEEKEKERERQKQREQDGSGEDVVTEQQGLEREEEKKEKEKEKEKELEKEQDRAKERENAKQKENEKAREKLKERERIREEREKERQRMREERLKEREKEKARAAEVKMDVDDDESDEDTSDEAYVLRHRGMRELIVRSQPQAHIFKDSELLLLNRKPPILPPNKSNLVEPAGILK